MLAEIEGSAAHTVDPQVAVPAEPGTDRQRAPNLRGPIYAFFLVASLALHAGVVALFFWPHAEPTAQPHQQLVIELQGIVQERQQVKEDIEETKAELAQPEPEQLRADQPKQAATAAQGSPAPEQQPAPSDIPPPEQHQPEAPNRAGIALPPPPKPKPKTGTARDETGAKQRQEAARIAEETEAERLRSYVRAMTKKVQDNLVYPADARQAGLQGEARVSFTILPSGEIRPDSLSIATSSGAPLLDTSALSSVRASLPFDPPPKEITVSIVIAFGPRS